MDNHDPGITSSSATGHVQPAADASCLLPPAAVIDPFATMTGPWWRGLTGYHWFVLVVAALGWLADCMDQQIFVLARNPALKELVGAEHVDQYAGYATSIFLLGWATGGLGFGILGDRIGRAKTMLLTVLIYSLFTGLSSLSVGFWDFALYRFLTGLGVGGEFAVGVALVAEVMPDRARPYALGSLQALSAIGNVSAALINNSVGQWRLMFLIGALPALLAVLIRSRLKEPERWQQALKEGGTVHKAGSLVELFGDPRWRRHAIFGMLLAFSGVVGLWGIGFFSYDFIRAVFYKHYQALDITVKETKEKLEQAQKDRQVFEMKEKEDPNGLSPDEKDQLKQVLAQEEAAKEAQKKSDEAINKKLTPLVGYVSLLQNLGGFLGVCTFSLITPYLGRKPTFLLAFLLAMTSTAGMFYFLKDFQDVFWMIPVMGFCQLMLFGGYAIYFPELFPTRLRSTGTSFCYNVGRFVAAIGPFTMGYLITHVFDRGDKIEAWRNTGVAMCLFFVIGIVALPFLPETKGRPLPE